MPLLLTESIELHVLLARRVPAMVSLRDSLTEMF